MGRPKLKIGVLIVAYNAESTISEVLKRIPSQPSFKISEVLIQDDYSTDHTYDIASNHLGNDYDFDLTVVRNEKNLGYGGNQKAGYLYAIEHDWDVVVLLHGDGQYAPEVMPDLVQPILDGNADAVFGSRMIEQGQARAGGMPLYKFVGNRILTTIQNSLAGVELSEWHSGYRAYRVNSLSELPFLSNSDVFDFDTEIILQLVGAKKRIAEVPIPTYYGDEICRVNGIRYAFDVVIDSLRYRFGQTGFGRGKLGHKSEPYAFKPSRYSSHGRVLRLLEEKKDLQILDVGCGPGWMAKELSEAGHTVVGIDAESAENIETRMDRFIQADLQNGIPQEVGKDFDVVVAADIIEHLPDPETLIFEMGQRCRPGGSVIISVPNIGHWYPRLRIATGQFGYDQRGILDRTHLRFFSRRTFRRMAKDAGLVPTKRAHTGLPLDALGLGDSRLAAATIGVLDRILVKIWPTLFAYQFVYEFSPELQGEVEQGLANSSSETNVANL